MNDKRNLRENKNKRKNSNKDAITNGERNDKKIIECRYNRKGNCKKGKQCEYKHTRDEENPENKDNEEKNNKEIVCKYYKTGNCMKGERCEYNHTQHKQSIEKEYKASNMKRK